MKLNPLHHYLLFLGSQVTIKYKRILNSFPSQDLPMPCIGWKESSSWRNHIPPLFYNIHPNNASFLCLGREVDTLCNNHRPLENLCFYRLPFKSEVKATYSSLFLVYPADILNGEREELMTWGRKQNVSESSWKLKELGMLTLEKIEGEKFRERDRGKSSGVRRWRGEWIETEGRVSYKIQE